MVLSSVAPAILVDRKSLDMDGKAYWSVLKTLLC